MGRPCSGPRLLTWLKQKSAQQMINIEVGTEELLVQKFISIFFKYVLVKSIKYSQHVSGEWPPPSSELEHWMLLEPQ